ncbi:MAG: hypothetical protein EHM93_18875 [Bacteroidales bacterium]|nr:MAG: hypothetical protein EHM93_18875 [Bacteroidales bacterium]
MKKLFFLTLAILLIFVGCKNNKLNNKKAEELIIKHLNYDAEHPKLWGAKFNDLAYCVEFTVNANALGEVNERSTSFYVPSKELSSFLPHFVNWAIDNGYFEKGELKEVPHSVYGCPYIELKGKGITKKGENYFGNIYYSFISETVIDRPDIPAKRKILFLQYSKPKVIGIRDVQNGMYEVIYQQGIEFINIDYVNSLKNYLPKPNYIPTEHTVVIKKYGEEYRFE